MSGLIDIVGTVLESKGLGFLSTLLGDEKDASNSQIIQMITEKTGLDISNPDILSNLDDQQISDIKDCVLSNHKDILEILYKFKEKNVDNTKHARDTYIQAITATKSKFLSYFPPIYATVVTFSGLAYIFMITFLTIPSDNQGYANTVLGFVMGSLISPILSFYFGSSDSPNTGIRNGANSNTKTTNLTCDVSNDVNERGDINGG